MHQKNKKLTNAEFIKLSKQHITLTPDIESRPYPPLEWAARLGSRAGYAWKDTSAIKKAATELKAYLSKQEGVSEVDDDLPYAQAEYTFELKPAAHQIGLSMSQIGQQLRAAYTGHLVQLYYQGDDEVEVRIRLDDETRSRVGSLENMPIKTAQGKIIPLISAVRIAQQKTFSSLPHWNGIYQWMLQLLLILNSTMQMSFCPE